MRGVRPNGSEASKMNDGMLADVVAHVGVAGLDGAVLHRVEHLQAGHDLARGEGLELEVAVGHFAHHAAHRLHAALERIETLGIAAGHAPFDLLVGLRDRGCGERRRGNAHGAGASLRRVIAWFLPDVPRCARLVGCLCCRILGRAPTAVDGNGRARGVGAIRSAQEGDEARRPILRNKAPRRLARRHEGTHRLFARQAFLAMNSANRCSIAGVGTRRDRSRCR